MISTDLICSEDGTKMIGARYTDTRPRTHWFDPVLQENQALIDKSVAPARRRSFRGTVISA